MGFNTVCFPPIHSYDDLKLYTNGFSEENFIGRTLFGIVYRGKIQQGSDATDAREVTVKIWVIPEGDPDPEGLFYDNKCRQRDEIMVLQDRRMISHPNLVKLIGYCSEGEHLGVVYDLKSLDTVRNLLIKDSFTWLQRIKVGLAFARLLEFLHARKPPFAPYLVRNIDAGHIMLDEDYNPKFFDFCMISGGILPDRSKIQISYEFRYFRYIDPYFGGKWLEGSDVFAFGVVLLGLISKWDFERAENRTSDKAFDIPVIGEWDDEWAMTEYKPKKPMFCFGRPKFSLVHQNLQAEPHFYSSDGHKISKLVMRCVQENSDKRPTMKQVVKYLLHLCVVRHHADKLGIDKECRGDDANPQKANLSGSEFS